MNTYCTSVIPIRIGQKDFTGIVLGEGIKKKLLHQYENYVGDLNLLSIPDINLNQSNIFFIPSEMMDIQCVVCDNTLSLILTWKKVYKNYYNLINDSLTRRNKLVKDILNYKSDDENLSQFLALLSRNKDKGISINYAFTFYSIYDKNYEDAYEKHIKVLAEPSLINMDDMLSSANIKLYNNKTVINEDALNNINNIDICSGQKTYVTWASIVSLSLDKNLFLKNHITMTLLEIIVQKIWNLCYTQNSELNNSITNIKSLTKNININKLIIETYRILIESKNCISATYSSRISGLHQSIIESSQLTKITGDLEQKLNYLIVFTNTINQGKNKNIQESSEIMLFLIAIAQVIPIFFSLPIITHLIISILTVVGISLIGIIIIRNKYRM